MIPARREPSAPDRLAEERAAPVEEHLLVCDECRKLAERTWAPDEAPELPYEKCTSDSESGCRCDVTWRIGE